MSDGALTKMRLGLSGATDFEGLLEGSDPPRFGWQVWGGGEGQSYLLTHVEAVLS